MDNREKVEHLTTEEVAARLRIPTWAAQNKAAQGLLPGFKVGRQWRFRLCDIEAWEEERVRDAQTRAEGRRGVKDDVYDQLRKEVGE